MSTHHLGHQSMVKPRKALSKSGVSYLRLEALEERCLLSGSSAIPYGPLPAVALGLTAEQVAHADAVINWNAAMLRAIWNAGTPPTAASRVEAMVGVAVYDAVDRVQPIYDLYAVPGLGARPIRGRSEEHTSELQSLTNLVC